MQIYSPYANTVNNYKTYIGKQYSVQCSVIASNINYFKTFFGYTQISHTPFKNRGIGVIANHISNASNIGWSVVLTA